MAIAYVGSTVNTASTTASTTRTLTYSPAAGHTLIVFCFGVGVAATGVSDGGTNSFSQKIAATTNTVTCTTFATGINASAAGSSLTLTVTFASSTRSCIVVVEYSGAAAFGLTGTNTGTSTAPSISITTQDANNYVVSGMSTQGTSTWAASVGTLRNSLAGAGSTTPGEGLMDATSVSQGSTTSTATITSGAWVAHALELRTVAPLIRGSSGMPVFFV